MAALARCQAPGRDRHAREQAGTTGRAVKRIALSGLALAAALAAGAGGYWAGGRGIAMPDALELFGGRSMAAEATVQRSGPVVYPRAQIGRGACRERVWRDG